MKEKEVKRVLEVLRIAKGPLKTKPVLKALKRSNVPIKKAYEIVLSMEGPVLRYLSEIEKIQEEGGLESLFDVKRERIRFYGVKSELEKAIEEGEGNKTCRDLFFPPEYVS